MYVNNSSHKWLANVDVKQLQHMVILQTVQLVLCRAIYMNDTHIHYNIHFRMCIIICKLQPRIYLFVITDQFTNSRSVLWGGFINFFQLQKLLKILNCIIINVYSIITSWPDCHCWPDCINLYFFLNCCKRMLLSCHTCVGR